MTKTKPIFSVLSVLLSLSILIGTLSSAVATAEEVENGYDLSTQDTLNVADDADSEDEFDLIYKDKVLTPSAKEGLISLNLFTRSVLKCVFAVFTGLFGLQSYWVEYGDENDGTMELVFEYTNIFFQHNKIFTGVLYDPVTNDYISEGDRGMLDTGYHFDIDHLTFYTVPYTWQRLFGYTWVYDVFSPLMGYAYETERVYFEYDGTEYLMQFWKGMYTSFTMVGGEIGLYYIPEGRKTIHYSCATEDMYVPISMRIYNDNEVFIDRDETNTWWMTGFSFATWQTPQTLDMDATATFQSEGMRDAFTDSLAEIDGITFTTDGNKVLISWPAKW